MEPAEQQGMPPPRRGSVLSNSVTLLTAARQAPLSVGISRQESWSGLPHPPPGGLPDPGTEPGSPVLQVDSSPSEPPGTATGDESPDIKPVQTTGPDGPHTGSGTTRG